MARASDGPSPNACRYCDTDRVSHLQRWAPGVKWHVWTEPTPEQRKARMLTRRIANTDRLTNPRATQ